MAEGNLMVAAVEAKGGKRLGKTEPTVAATVRLQFFAQTVGGQRAHQLPVDQHVERRARRLADALAHPAACRGALDGLEHAVDLLRPQDQRRIVELDPVRHDANRGAGNKFVQRDRAHEAAETVVAVDPGPFAAQAIGDRLRRALPVDIEGDPDPAPREISVKGPAENRPRRAAPLSRR